MAGSRSKMSDSSYYGNDNNRPTGQNEKKDEGICGLLGSGAAYRACMKLKTGKTSVERYENQQRARQKKPLMK